MRGRLTTYRGVTFRSRLEARWALFFDMLHVPWVYEPGMFEFYDDSVYTPDFYLPSLRAYVEIKPVELSHQEQQKAIKLAVETSVSVYSFVGSPRFAHDMPNGQIEKYTTNAHILTQLFWTSCETSGKIGIAAQGAQKALGCCNHTQSDLGHSTGRVFTATVIAKLYEFK